MLETRTLVTSIKLEPQDLSNCLLKLSNEGWKPALFEAQRTFLNMAGVADKMLTIPTQSDVRGRVASNSIAGDIFFRDDGVYYIVLNAGGAVAIDRYGRIIRRYEDEKPTIEIGVISNTVEGINQQLQLFVTAIESAIKSSVDGRKARHITFYWNEKRPASTRMEEIIQSGGEQSGVKLNRACLDKEEITACNILASKLARDTLIEISQAGFVRERDLLSRKTKNIEDIKAAIEQLKVGGLLNSEYLLECKRTGTPLTRLQNRLQVTSPEVSSLICPSCNSPFGQELLSEGYSLSSLGRKMSRQSYWMTVWVTNLLHNLGIPLDSILWNVTESGEEVDLLVGFLGQLWIFELKDREFGSGDAYPLNYRQVRYRANKAIIITTEKVAKDARRVFDELIRESRRPERNGPLYIEGLSAAEEILRKEVSNASLRYAQQRLSILGEISGYDLSSVLQARFGETVIPSSQDDLDTPF